MSDVLKSHYVKIVSSDSASIYNANYVDRISQRSIKPMTAFFTAVETKVSQHTEMSSRVLQNSKTFTFEYVQSHMYNYPQYM